MLLDFLVFPVAAVADNDDCPLRCGDHDLVEYMIQYIHTGTVVALHIYLCLSPDSTESVEHTINIIQQKLHAVHRKYLAGEKLVNLANCEPFAKSFLANSHGYTEKCMWHMH